LQPSSSPDHGNVPGGNFGVPQVLQNGPCSWGKPFNYLIAWGWWGYRSPISRGQKSPEKMRRGSRESRKRMEKVENEALAETIQYRSMFDPFHHPISSSVTSSFRLREPSNKELRPWIRFSWNWFSGFIFFTVSTFHQVLLQDLWAFTLARPSDALPGGV
jgi:hypothetical protein